MACRHQRDAVKAELQKLLKALRKRGAVVGKPLLITARVPIIKCTLAVPGGRIPADISLGVANGLSAVALVEQQVAITDSPQFAQGRGPLISLVTIKYWTLDYATLASPLALYFQPLSE